MAQIINQRSKRLLINKQHIKYTLSVNLYQEKQIHLSDWASQISDSDWKMAIFDTWLVFRYVDYTADSFSWQHAFILLTV